jgi:hypothetical protein
LVLITSTARSTLSPWGRFTFADAQAHMKLEVREHARGYHKYVDFRGAGIQISPAEIRQIVERL